MKTNITNEQADQLLAIDIQHGKEYGFTFGFAVLLENKGYEANKVVNEIVSYVKPNSSLTMQLFGVAHNLQFNL